MRRREFLASSPLLVLGSGFSPAKPSPQAAPKGPDLREQLSAGEMEIVNRSAMARDLDNFFGKGFS